MLWLMLYLVLLVIVVVILAGYELFEFVWPGIRFVWDVLTAALYWPLDMLLRLLHVQRADTNTPDEGEGDE
jgi:hypothetical protein